MRRLLVASVATAAIVMNAGSASAGAPSGSGPSSETPAIDHPPGCEVDQGAEEALGDAADRLGSGHPAFFELIVAQQDVRLFCFGFGER